MSYLESLSITEEPKIVIVDIGAAYTKVGLAGETGPRCIVPSQVKNPRNNEIVNVWSYNNTSDLFESLKDLLYSLIFKRLQVTPKDKRVVVVESLLCNSDFRETLAKVLFKHFEFASVLFASSHLLSLLTLGINIGLVMDIGYQETLVIPVYDGIPIMKGWQSLPVAGKAIESRVKSQLMEHGTVSTPEQKFVAVSTVPECITDDIIEDIKVRCCFVTNFERGQKIQEVTMRGGHANNLPPPPPDTDYPLDGGSILNISGRIREHSCEVLFEQDNEETSVATLLLEALINCPIDTRQALANSVVVTGGTAMMPGFYHRLQCELTALLQKPCYSSQLGIKQFKFHVPPSKENYTAWLGGALIGDLETLPSKSISRDAYLQKGKLPDWCCVDTVETS